MYLIVNTKKFFSAILKYVSGNISTNQNPVPECEPTPAKEILNITETCERKKSKEGFFRLSIDIIKGLLTAIKLFELLCKIYRYRHLVAKMFWIIVMALFDESFLE